MSKYQELGDFVKKLEKKLPIKQYLSRITEVDGDAAKCPFHYDEGYGMFLTPGSNMFECYDCGCMGLSLTSFKMLWEKKSFYTVLKELSEETGIDIPENIQNEMTFFLNRQKYE